MGTRHRLRVLWLIKGLGRGGAEQLLVSHAAAGDHQSFDYEASYLFPPKTALVGALEQRGVPVSLLDPGVGWPARLRRRLVAHPVDVLHVHSPAAAAVARCVVLSLPRRGRPALVYTEHNRWPMYRWPTRIVNAVTYGLDDVKIAVSTDVRDSVPKRLRSDLEVLVHGIDRGHVASHAPDRATTRRHLRVARDDVLIANVANLRREKGHDVLLRAARRVLDVAPQAVFVSVGLGPEADSVRRLHGELELGDRFHLLGFREDALSLLAAADVFCLASRHEGLPVALMEAMTLSLPVAATTAGGIPEAVRDGEEALLVPPDDVGALAEALIRLVKDAELRRDLGDGARARSELFDASRAVARIEEIYRAAVGSRADRVV